MKREKNNRQQKTSSLQKREAFLMCREDVFYMVIK